MNAKKTESGQDNEMVLSSIKSQHSLVRRGWLHGRHATHFPGPLFALALRFTNACMSLIRKEITG